MTLLGIRVLMTLRALVTSIVKGVLLASNMKRVVGIKAVIPIVDSVSTGLLKLW